MTTRIKNSSSGLLIAAAALLAGCDGGVGTAGIDGTGAPIPNPIVPDPSPPKAPAVSSVIAYGAVTAFGSVWVNGVRYDTSQATFTINGSLGNQSDLEIGDVVLVVGTLDPDAATGVARQVVFDSLVEGPISAIDAEANSFVALGQTVEITPTTSFDDAIPQQALAGLSIGDVVEVSGFRAANGEIKATRVAFKEFGRREFETTGVVANHDGVARRFNVNALVVDYSVAMLEAFPSGAIADGDVVEVRGSSLRADGAFVATSVELNPAVSGNAGDRVEMEGYIKFASCTTCFTTCTPYPEQPSFSLRPGTAHGVHDGHDRVRTRIGLQLVERHQSRGRRNNARGRRTHRDQGKVLLPRPRCDHSASRLGERCHGLFHSPRNHRQDRRIDTRYSTRAQSNLSRLV